MDLGNNERPEEPEMPREKISMRKIREIVRLGIGHGLSQRDVAQSTGVSKTVVQGLLKRAEGHGLTWERAKEMNDPDIVALLYPPVAPKELQKVEPDWATVRLELMRKGVTLSLLWLV
jgi:hypothetical protein